MSPTADEYREGMRLLQQQQRARLTAFIEQVDRALARDWQRSMGYAAPLYRPLIDQYARDLAALRREMDDPSARLTLDWLTARNAQLRTIEQSVRASLDKYGSASAAKVTQAQAAAAERGAADAAQLTQRSLWPAVEGAGVPPAMLFNRPNPDAIAQWVGRAGNGHPLGDLFANFGAEATQQARKEMLLGLATGANPRAMAKGISNALGISRSRATIISRTEVLGSYRSAAHETYRANSDVINGWLWSAGGNNPCFPAGTLIATKRGRVAIEDVVVGDLVLTHRGQFRRVTEIMSRSYHGPMTTIEAEDGRRVMATASHPFLIERQGQLDWIEAGQLRLSDGVVSEHERTTKIIDHRLSDDPIEGRIRQSHNPVALALEIERLAHIAGSSARVPVDAINLQHGVEAGQVEVNRVAPTIDHELLPVVDSQSLKTETRSPFWLGLTRMATIAADGAETTARYLTRLGTDFLAALKTSEGLRGASAFFRAVMSIGRPAKQLPTARTGARSVDVGDGSATDTGSGAVDTTSDLTALDAERVAALRADLLDAVRSNVAVSGAVLPPAAAMISQKRLAALATNAFNGGIRNLPAHGMRVSPLMLGVAGSGAKAPIAPRIVRGRDIEGDAAVLTDAFHIQSITRIAHHIQQSGLMVFNLEVEGDQTYVANGFAVHNCAMCMGMDGLQFSLEEELVDHPCGKCSPIPITKSWDDILGPLGIDSSDMLETSMGADGAYETGEARFARMSPQQQRAIIGTRTGYDAYRRGEVSLKDFIGKRPAQDGFPASYYQKSLKEMEIPTGRAGSNLVERSPRLTELERAGNLRLRDFGAPIPVDEMPVWAQQSPASQAVYQILRNGLPWGMREQEAQLLQVNLEQMLKEELPLNVRLAALRQQDVLAQYEQYLNIHVRNITGGASTLERGEVPAFVYRPSKELERALAAARVGERTALETAQTVETALEGHALSEVESAKLIDMYAMPSEVERIQQAAYSHIADRLSNSPAWIDYLVASGKTPERAIEDLAQIFRGTILEGEGNAANVGAMMMAVRDELGLTDARTGFAESLKDAQALYARDGAALRAYVRAVYEDTQQYFRNEGISEVTLFRGGALGDKPFNSFSIDRDHAAIYGKPVREVRVPVEQILGLPQSGLGNAREGEVIVLARDAAVAYVDAADAANAAHAAVTDTEDATAAARDLSQRDLERIVANREVFTDPNTGRTDFWTAELNGEQYFIRPAYGEVSQGSALTSLADRVGLGDNFVKVQTVEVDGKWYEVQPLLVGKQADEAVDVAKLSTDAYLNADERMKVSIFSSLLGEDDRMANNMWITPDDKLLQIDYGNAFGTSLYAPYGNLLRPIDFGEEYAVFQALNDAPVVSESVMEWLRTEVLSSDTRQAIMDNAAQLAAGDSRVVPFQAARLEAYARFAQLPGTPNLGELRKILQSEDIRQLLLDMMEGQ